MAEVEQRKQRPFRKFTYRGIDLDQLLDISYEKLMQLYSVRQRQRLNHSRQRKQHSLLKWLRKSEVVKMHLRNMIILPEMVGSMVGPEMIGHYLGEFSITYKWVKHGQPGIAPTLSSRFIPLR
ncbi:hypothetical protein FD755_025028 [Muntiacus reevesi]|uniref:40S ribosomal protein S15 n=1 Tax=Muntiacus reevesi TaxID=9886 RepID=A0A5N3URL3_MUNRE|nr:hypothetical protein FD755_025028 [Muntiacus reevesi]